MIALLQRVSEASVLVNDQLTGPRITGAIGTGILALIGVEKGDSKAQADRLLERVCAYRIFPDADDKMNLNLEQAGGKLLLVPHSFTSAAPPDEGQRLFAYLLEKAKLTLGACETGEFGADMKVSLVNDGPVTFWLRVPN
jgi:D-tyrosyl-tRNA(Tyr) deacylase